LAKARKATPKSFLFQLSLALASAGDRGKDQPGVEPGGSSLTASHDSASDTSESESVRPASESQTMAEGSLYTSAPDSSVAGVLPSTLQAASAAGIGGHRPVVPQAGGVDALAVGVQQGLTPGSPQLMGVPVTTKAPGTSESDLSFREMSPEQLAENLRQFRTAYKSSASSLHRLRLSGVLSPRAAKPPITPAYMAEALE
jgi:hypothetical protein